MVNPVQQKHKNIQLNHTSIHYLSHLKVVQINWISNSSRFNASHIKWISSDSNSTLRKPFPHPLSSGDSSGDSSEAVGTAVVAVIQQPGEGCCTEHNSSRQVHFHVAEQAACRRAVAGEGSGLGVVGPGTAAETEE